MKSSARLTGMTAVQVISESKRLELASRVQRADDIPLPAISGWNDQPCQKHSKLTQGCSDCGMVLRKHQRVGAAWLYFIEKGLLADLMGCGKTGSISALIGLIRDKGELENGKVIVVCRALMQWQSELNRALPTLRTMVASGTRKQRLEKYLHPWDVLLITQQMLISDIELVLRFPLALVVSDDVDAIRHGENKTSYNVKRLARYSRRVVIASGTPLQKRLLELYHALAPVGGTALLGSEYSFKRRYIIEDSTGRPLAYQNINHLKQRIAPIVLRRTTADIDDVEMPDIVSENYFLELYRAQRLRYEELQQGVVRLIREERTAVRRVTALSKLIYGAGICSGLATLGEPDGPGMSSKLDWLTDKLTGDLEDEKVVIFINRKDNLRAMQDRLRRMNVGFETIWGEQPDKIARHNSQLRFWNDASCRILLGTTSIEQSLNLQVARHLINVDTIRNPARMAQLAGRVRRDGSKFKTVYVHNLLTVDTQEERYLPLLEREAALASYMWNESSELYEALSPLQLLDLIVG